MYEYVRGIVASCVPSLAVVEAHGVGYRVIVPLSTSAALTQGREARLWLHHTLNADQGEERLYGFATERERELFRALLAVDGVGPSTAIQMMCAAEPDELIEAIAGGDTARLKRFKGIGPKRAERLVLELRERMQPLAAQPGSSRPSAPTSPSRKDAVLALAALGYPTHKAEEAVSRALDEKPEAGTEALVRRALQLM